ncbi:hypothetical protein ACWDLG_30555 [Nonomuraea sp. NPDC003727]
MKVEGAGPAGRGCTACRNSSVNAHDPASAPTTVASPSAAPAPGLVSTASSPTIPNTAKPA